MTELWIKFTDENGEYRRVNIDKETFVIGRHSACDIAVANPKLSREHLRIDRSGERFLVSDCGSSNGTELNYNPLVEPVEVMNGDRADLGGGLEVEFEYIWEDTAGVEEPRSDVAQENGSAPAAAAALPLADTESGSSGGFPVGILVIGPLAAIFLLVVGLGAFYLISRPTGTAAEITTRNRSLRDPEDEPRDNREITTSTPSPSPNSETPDNTNKKGVNDPPPANLSGTAKIEQASAAFLRRIAHNDHTAFLTADQSQKVSGRIKQLSGSQALAANIESARKSSSQLKALADAKNLTPQFLTAAALAKLGTNRGDVLQTAQSMAGVFEKLNTQIGSELSDDSLMMIAAYDQGQRGDFMGLRNTLQDLSTKFPESARAIRTIWFLQKQGKISAAEFDFALQFLAIGTITQSPKDFGINAEPLTL